ncbi:hypothetical protein N7522_004225 [Penicillium canescens]|uniref:Uncharacterized protein n=1 Tax=Penicillium canescens TaxID=5083 RepID=A0AAD6N3P3_PENCN|nr:uncharacterized protein N7446_004119 [Penicillium canescens]KAJ6009209.1 hypothetical protein N7522_004225 [Penicillium canescens]KAJ6027282.1 hypothetical protein N7460_012099 [Penicillium canescens]KAJ6040565.1 hypothetical protein N7444_009470 [Penicillium canescens]KAJ6067082.1 hypothetical protein N7446_004119 [Penicillium canescens]
MDTESDATSDELPTPQPTRSKIQASFLIARPPPKSSLCLTPKLLLQFQQLTSNGRSRPVMELWHPSIRKPKLTPDFHQRPKMRSGDIYATCDEPYIINSHNVRKQAGRSPKQRDENCISPHKKDVVTVMCRSRDTTQVSTINFRNEQCTWQASAHPAGPANHKLRYRFTLNDEHSDGRFSSRSMSMQWEKRQSDGGDNESTGECESEYFVLCFIDHKARRKGRIATMTQSRLDVRVRKTSIIEHLQACLDLTRSTVSDSESSERLEIWLYTHVLPMGTWVAEEEGWLNHPRYK